MTAAKGGWRQAAGSPGGTTSVWPLKPRTGPGGAPAGDRGWRCRCGRPGAVRKPAAASMRCKERDGAALLGRDRGAADEGGGQLDGIGHARPRCWPRYPAIPIARVAGNGTLRPGGAAWKAWASASSAACQATASSLQGRREAAEPRGGLEEAGRRQAVAGAADHHGGDEAGARRRRPRPSAPRGAWSRLWMTCGGVSPMPRARPRDR